MSNHDEKPGAPQDIRRSPASHRESPDRIPRRDTAPAGTPAQKSTSASYQQSALNPPEEPIPPPVAPPVVRVASERPPGVDTISPPRTVGGQTARLKVKQPPEDGPAPTAQDGKPAGSAKNRSAAEVEEGAAQPAPKARQGDERSAAKAVARGAKEGRASGEVDVKISEPEPAGQKAQAVTPGGPVESRWPIAIALGAIAFALGSLLPLPFRKQIVGSTADAVGVVGNPTPPSTTARIPLAPVPPQARTPGAVAQPPGPFPPGAAPSPSATPTERPAAPGATAAPNASSSAGKSPGKPGGKPGRIGDIF
jgi:hypothetical protein